MKPKKGEVYRLGTNSPAVQDHGYLWVYDSWDKWRQVHWLRSIVSGERKNINRVGFDRLFGSEEEEG